MSTADQALIRAIQTRRRKLAGLADDELWRDRLAGWTGVRSLTAMTRAQLAAVLDAVTKLGPAGPSPATVARQHGLKYMLTPQVQKLRAMWITLGQAGVVRHPTDAALSAFIARVTGVELGRLPPADVTRVIKAMTAMAARAGALGPDGRIIVPARGGGDDVPGPAA